LGPGDAARLTVFLAVATGVLGGAAWILLVRLRRRLRRLPPPPGGRRRLFENAVLGAAAMGVVCIAWGVLVEPRLLTVTRVRVETAKMAAGARPIRVVHLTDLHCDAEPRLEERLPDAVAREEPDAIVFTGDAVNSPAGLPIFRRLLGRLASVAPTFAVAGNWDVWIVRGLDRFGGTGARELDGDAARVTVRGTDLWVAGVAPGHEDRAAAALAQVPRDAVTLFLHHFPYPEVVPAADRGRVDLFCAGHVHGGQVALPLYGAVITLSRHGKRYEHGLYEVEGGMRLFVSRGIGMEGGPAPRVRFSAPPEIAVIEIAPRR
jgi:predicted MPP superfamily phosphohydrolase